MLHPPKQSFDELFIAHLKRIRGESIATFSELSTSFKGGGIEIVVFGSTKHFDTFRFQFD
jgi:hypothetical protein